MKIEIPNEQEIKNEQITGCDTVIGVGAALSVFVAATELISKLPPEIETSDVGLALYLLGTVTIIASGYTGMELSKKLRSR